MPDQEVLINDSNLNAIANAIRRKNGLVRTYKPREMAPAIRAINADAPDSREYTVTVIQSDHQTIKVKQYLGGEKMYSESFTVSEPFWKAQATVEPDAGYVAGVLNYQDEITIDRDYIISASPAMQVVEPQETIINAYVKGTKNTSPQSLTGVYSDEQCTAWLGKDYTDIRPHNITYNFIDKNDGSVPHTFRGLFSAAINNTGGWNAKHSPDATSIVNNINTKGAVTISRCADANPWLETIDVSNFDLSETEYIDSVVTSSDYLKSFGNISHWDTRVLREASNLIRASRYVNSLDLSNWYTPELRVASNLIYGDNARILDISNWDTSNLTTFTLASGMTYLIMDKDEVKFSGNLKCAHPNNYIKYLVPEDRVDDYKQHPNWSAWANQIDSITNYTINRGDGQVEVVPNW